MPSSKTSIDHRDIYYRLGKSAGYRARSAFKLLHLDEDFDLFSGVETAVDLCAAPGSWSQVLADKMEDGLTRGKSKVVAVDLQPMADITLPSTVPLVLETLGGRKADLVVCDGAPDVTGVHDLDAYLHSQLILAALTLALTILAPGGTLIFKIFVSPLDPYAMMIKSQLRPFFLSPDDFPSGSGGFDKQGRRGGVWNRKPRSSRPGSGEQFVVCRNFNADVVPLPQLFSAESLEEMKAQTSGTLSLDSLGDLGDATELAEGKEWRITKAYAESGDLNPMADDEEVSSDPMFSRIPPSRKQLLTLDTQTPSDPSSLVIGPTPQSAQAETPVASSSTSTVFLSPQKIPSGGTSPTVRNLRDRAQLFIRGGPNHLGTSTQSSIDSITPPPSSSPTSYTHDRPWDRQAPSPLPSPIILHPPGAPPDGLLALPQPKQPVKSTSTPVFSHSLAKFKEEEFRHSPLAPDDGAVSPALSTSSKTDLFFAAAQVSELPKPPKPLPNASSLGRSSSLAREARERDRERSSTVPNTPAGSHTPTFQEEGSHLARSESLSHRASAASTGPAESSLMGRARSNTRDRSTGWRSVSSPTQSIPPTPPRQSGYTPRSPFSSALHVVPDDAMILDEMSDMLPSPTRSSASFNRRESHLAREVRNVPKEYSLQPGMILIPVDGPDPFDPTTPPLFHRHHPPNGSSGQDQSPHEAWKLDRKLGEGAFSAVWAASASSGSKLSAVKLTSQHPQSTSATDQTLMRTHVSFLREKSVLRRISHPGIVGFIDSFSTETHHCLVLERIGGGELFEYVADEVLWKRSITPSPALDGAFDGMYDPTGEGFVKRVFGELCEAVGWLHSVGVVHRDIKLENILLTTNPFALAPTSTSSIPLALLPPRPAPLIKLTDFGLSRFINPSSPLLETRCGSESFAAPEIIMGRPYDGRSTDSWACGVVLYTLLTGIMPFDEPSPASFPNSGNTSTLEGRARGSSVSSVASTGSNGLSEEKERRRRIMRIAKGQYSFPANSSASGEARAIVERLLVRDPKKRAGVGKEVLEMEWWSSQPPFRPFHHPVDTHNDPGREAHPGADGQGESLVARRVGNGVIYDGGLEEGLYGDID